MIHAAVARSLKNVHSARTGIFTSGTGSLLSSNMGPLLARSNLACLHSRSARSPCGQYSMYKRNDRLFVYVVAPRYSTMLCALPTEESCACMARSRSQRSLPVKSFLVQSTSSAQCALRSRSFTMIRCRETLAYFASTSSYFKVLRCIIS
jgi:hypothetical protein